MLAETFRTKYVYCLYGFYHTLRINSGYAISGAQILKRLGTEEKYGSNFRSKGKVDGVVMVNFAPFTIAPDGKATLERVADHIEYIGNVTGREQYAPFPSIEVNCGC